MEKKLVDLQKTFTESCEFYLIDKSDEKAQNSQEYFKFFCSFFDQVNKSMPKEEKKRAAASKVTAGAGAAQKKFGAPGMGNLMSELKMKQGQ